MLCVRPAIGTSAKRSVAGGAGTVINGCRREQADKLIDGILICLNACIHGISVYSLDDTIHAIVREIGHYQKHRGR